MENQGTYYEDKELICGDCNQPFTFTGGEQRFYAEREFSDPKRCKGCRAEKKARRQQTEDTQPARFWADDNSDNDRGNGRRNGRRNRGRR